MRSTLEKKLEALEKRLFEIVSLIMFVLMGFFFIEGALVWGSLPTIILNGVLSIMGITLYYLSRYRGMFSSVRLILVFSINVFYVFYFYWLSGIYGPTAVGGIAVGVVSIIVVPPKYRNLVFVIFSGVLLFLVFSQKFTDWVRLAKDDYKTLYLDYSLWAVTCLLITNFLKSRFDKERTLVHEKNEQLEVLNAELISALEEKKIAIEELQRMQDQLVEKEKMASIGRLTSGITHELNNPLNYIGGIVLPVKRDLEELKALISEENREEAEEILEEIDLLLQNVDEGTTKARGIIQNLSSLLPYKISKNGGDQEVFNLSLSIRDIMIDFGSKHPSILIDSNIEDDIMVHTDPGDLKLIISSVIENALQALDKNKPGKIVVSLAIKDSKAIITVKDNGVGILKEEVKNVMDPFYTTKPQGHGKGLGLFIVYNLIKVNRGRITIDSEHGVGTEVSIELPLAQELIAGNIEH